MKTLRLVSFASFSALLLFFACKADTFSDRQPSNGQPAGSTAKSDPAQPGQNAAALRIASSSACNAYAVSLESKTPVGSNWEWIWTVQNLNPGNGNNGTVQNLSHWGMQFGSCFNFSSVVQAAYSANGVNWTSFTPVYQVDPSQNCMTTPVLKFDFGTTGSNPSYYKLVLNQNYEPGSTAGYYKSGSRTGCCTFNFTGVSCIGIAEEK